jgi:hypothetical protein
MTRFILSLVIAIGVATSVDADVLDLLKAGLSARIRRDFEAAIDYYTQAIETGNLSPNDLAVVINSRGVASKAKPTRPLLILMMRFASSQTLARPILTERSYGPRNDSTTEQ